MKKVLSMGLALAAALSLTACKGGSTSSSGESLSGKVSLNGSTSMEKYVTALGEGFKEKYPDMTVETQFTGSSAGLQALIDGQCDIADSSRSLTPAEKKKGLVENVVAIDGIAISLNKKNKVNNVTSKQLADIYTGKITNWKQLGGADEKIVVIGRESASGTRAAFEELLKVENKCKYAQELDNTGAVVAKCASTTGAIGYVSLDAVDNTIKTAKLNGVEATESNIKAGTYKLSRPFVMATKGAISKQNKKVQAIFKYVNSDEGQKILKKVGLISAKK
ncbi:phosphate ABC transporter substrate-binding protein [Intestinibaculum porci]|jgi:phosphate transport system substrate-binding protein|uniref:phosphate ABC transporter substrate-binding protein n=1 Tax=Intestinibaculum porci TaxID=2487118 RepID=UPI00240A4877|nr:phosphate ABC transporter substrate-binding protein [Intestinibaculum porci]MDD6350218.1 phosphate ABC transporter substrate-binding protein [Intestinibaculum porci]